MARNIVILSPHFPPHYHRFWLNVKQAGAHALGIGRGADLVFYCAVVIMMIGFWMVYVRLRGLRREMTMLVRHLAILEARKEYLSNESESGK